MAQGDLTVLESSVTQGGRGGRLYNVAAGTPIYAGEPVQIRAVGNVVVEPNLTSTPIVSVSAGVEGLFVGVASTNSTNTTTAAGTVLVQPTNSAITYLANPAAPTSWDTQAEYDALVGKRVLLQNSVSVTATPTSGTYTILAADSANNGCSVQAMNILEHSAKVAFAFRTGTSNLL
jgi:cytoskeletal protein RodZ